MEQKWSELRLWNGGICPVGPDEMVWVLYEDMCEERARARHCRWLRKGEPADIIAYRVEVKPAPLIERWVNVYTDADGVEWAGDTYYDTKNAARIAAGPDARQILLREVRE